MSKHPPAGATVRPRVVSVVGTRPEAIKMAPVIRELARHPDRFESVVVASSQHREMLRRALADLGIVPDVDLELMALEQRLSDFASRALRSIADCYRRLAPDAVLVQGDTTTAAMAALAGYYENALIGHVEAGLRSFAKRDPFPEEVNRRLIGTVADLHFAPTGRARENLLREGVPAESIFVTGNTVVDALRLHSAQGAPEDPTLRELLACPHRLLLVTAHRRENHARRLRSICAGVRRLAERFEDVEIVFPVHPNPAVRRVVLAELAGAPRTHLLGPLARPDLLRLLQRCWLVLSDSGGLQEEAPSFGKPVLILRERTERPELVESGGGILVGTGADRIVAEASRLLTDPEAYRAMCCAHANPFGDGHAARRIVEILARRLPGIGPLQPTPAGARERSEVA